METPGSERPTQGVSSSFEMRCSVEFRGREAHHNRWIGDGPIERLAAATDLPAIETVPQHLLQEFGPELAVYR